MQIREQVPLAPLTTLGVGGAAQFYTEAATAAQIAEAVEWSRERRLPVFLLGGGSNLLVSDGGFPGLVVKIAIRGIQRATQGERALFVAGAGEDWDGVVARAVEAGCAGLECLSGIPGTVGGTPVQNVGAYGQEVSDTVTEVEALDLRTGNTVLLGNGDCRFEYRRSRFNTADQGNYAIVRVTYSLVPGGAPRVAYRDLRDYFAARDIPNPSLAQVREAVREIRRGKGMLLVEGDEENRSAGSFFKNPVLPPEKYERLKQLAAKRGMKVPTYPADGQQCKIPAAWLVEQAGFHKGYVRGRAGISRRHALAIVNRGGATAADIIALKDEIQAAVRENFGVELSPEPVLVGQPF